MKTSLFGGRPLRLITRRRKQVETLSDPLELFIAAEYLTIASAPPSGFQITVAETLQAPSQSSMAQTGMPVIIAQSVSVPVQSSSIQTVMPVTIAQTMPTPIQTIAAETGAASFQITVNQSMPDPSQSSTLEAQGGAVKKNDGGAWEYYPPIYAIRTKGKQSVPAPSQGVFVKADKPIIYADPIPPKKQAVVYGVQSMPLPGQCVIMKSHRTIKKRDDEEEKILMLLMGVA